MKDKETILSKVKAYFSETPELENLEVVEKVVKTEEVTNKFEEVTLADGVTIANVEPALEVGASMTITLEDGTIAPAPIAEYELADGVVVVVEVDGVIADIKTVEVEDEVVPVEEEEMAENNNAIADQKVRKVIESIVKESVFELTEKFAKDNEFLHKQNDALKIIFAELKENTGVALKEVFETPVKEPIKKKKNVFAKNEEVNIFIKKTK